MSRSIIEKKLLGDIQEIERLVTRRHRLPEMRSAAQWERNFLLSTDRNDLIRLGVCAAFSSVEFFMEGMIVNYFMDNKKYSFRTKKWQLFENSILRRLDFSDKITLLREAILLPPAVNRFLTEVVGLKENAARNLSEMEPGMGCGYQGRSIFDLAVFKRFCQNADKATDFLMNKMIKMS